MKVKVFAVLLLASCVLAKDHGDLKEKRATGATPKPYATASPEYAKVSPQTFQPQSSKDYQIKYLQQQPQQYQYEYEPKLSSAKVAYAQQQIPFSLASDVSSFSYQSPLVSYSNLGLLKQAVGKIAESQVPAYNPQQYTSEAKLTAYTQQPQAVAYVPQKAYTQKLSLVSPQPQQSKVAYAPVSNKVVYAAAAQQPQQYSKQVIYAPKAAAQEYESQEDAQQYQYQPQYTQQIYQQPSQAYQAQASQVYQQPQAQTYHQAAQGGQSAQLYQQGQQQYILVHAQPQYEQQAASSKYQQPQYYQAQAQPQAKYNGHQQLVSYTQQN